MLNQSGNIHWIDACVLWEVYNWLFHKNGVLLVYSSESEQSIRVSSGLTKLVGLDANLKIKVISYQLNFITDKWPLKRKISCLSLCYILLQYKLLSEAIKWSKWSMGRWEALHRSSTPKRCGERNTVYLTVTVSYHGWPGEHTTKTQQASITPVWILHCASFQPIKDNKSGRPSCSSNWKVNCVNLPEDRFIDANCEIILALHQAESLYTQLLSVSWWRR